MVRLLKQGVVQRIKQRWVCCCKTQAQKLVPPADRCGQVRSCGAAPLPTQGWQ